MKNREQIQWGIIGCGDVAEVKSGPAFQKASDSKLLAVMRRSGAKAADFAKRHGVEFWYDSVDPFLANEDIDAVYIATPPSTHVELAERSIRAGKKVYLEKPLALNLAQAHRLEACVKKHRAKLTVAHYRRELPAFKKVSELLRTGAIGKVLLADITILQPARSDLIAQTADNWRLNPEISGGGYFHDIAPHQIDLICQFFGEAALVSGCSGIQGDQSEAPDITTGFVQFRNGVHFRGSWCFNDGDE